MYHFIITLIWLVLVSAETIHLYNSDRLSNNELFYQCLYYYPHDPSILTADLEWSQQIIPFCLRPLQPSMDKYYNEGFVEATKCYTFKELRQDNFTARQLFSTSAPIDFVERYQMYLDEPNELFSKELFCQCRSGYFGDICQFMFDYVASFNDIVSYIFGMKEDVKSQMDHKYNGLTCYVHLKCNRGPIPMCLDWREVCDGKVDCIDNNIDELGCDLLELSDCDTDYYRCHNGAQCIPIIMFNDDLFNPDCLDGSDEIPLRSLVSRCLSNPSFICEERMCSHVAEFTCGNGICDPFPYISFENKCDNARSELFRKVIFSHTSNLHLNYDCWSSMICLTKIKSTNLACDEHDCGTSWSQACLMLINETCPIIFAFPATPIMFSHVYFVYSSNQSHYGHHYGPEYFCYNASLCGGFLSPTININGSTCSSYQDLGLKNYSNWNELIRTVQVVFGACSSIVTFKEGLQTSHLFCCSNSSKCISKFRLVDGMSDCFEGFDEKYDKSCLLEQHQRYKCSYEEKCLSFIAVENDNIDCVNGDDEFSSEQRSRLNWPPFPMLCDIYQDMYSVLINGYNETDETSCEMWPCNNVYTKCDGLWHCPNGIDEINCSNSHCSSDSHPCISMETLNLTCITLEKAGDGRVDCLGGTDEQMYCQQTYPDSPTVRYHCWNDTRCLSTQSLCNRHTYPSESLQCPHREDQTLCPIEDEDLNIHFDRRRGICSEAWDDQRTVSEQLLCNLANDYESNTLIQRPTIYTKFRPTTDLLRKSFLLKVTDSNFALPSNTSRLKVSPSTYEKIWYCNRGILIRLSESRTKRCLCPPNYYGDRCEYQSQRVALTLEFQPEIMPVQQTIFSFVVMLIDNESQINSYEKILYTPRGNCDIKFNINLLFATRPKNISNEYYIHINGYVTNNLQYHISWLIAIPFQFLPVNRIANVLKIPARPLKYCSMSCGIHGQCTQYENSAKLFCKCAAGWSGHSCNIQIDCNCSSDSICTGNANNRSICVCPLGKIGPRCYIKSASCHENECKNGGLCIPFDERKSEYGYKCICNDQFTGLNCEKVSTKITISFVDIPKPSFISIHFITALGDQPLYRLIKFQKIPYDVNLVTLRQVVPFQLLFIEINQIYYLTIVRENFILWENISVEVTSSQKCLNVRDLFNNTVLEYHLLRRMKYYHLPCQNNKELVCFYDEKSMCICNSDQQANCYENDLNQISNCKEMNPCYNDAHCLQDRLRCPTSYTCICLECYHGSLCQFSTRSLGVSLDSIIGYQIQPHLQFARQPYIVKFIVILTVLLIALGYICSVLSILTFNHKNSRDVGCGTYLLASSWVLSMMVTVLGIKTVQLILTQMHILTRHEVVLVSCYSLDALLNILLEVSGWLTACVAIERTVSVIKKVSFDKTKSKKAAKWIILIIILTISCTALLDLTHRQLLFIENENRTWCVTVYPTSLKSVDSVINFFHFLTPLSINILSALIIIFETARTRSNIRQNEKFTQHIFQQLRQHKHILISPCFLIVLALPRLFIPSCMTSQHNPWLFIASYLLSFMPSILTFPIFVFPSRTYSNAFKDSFIRQHVAIRRHLHFC